MLYRLNLSIPAISRVPIGIRQDAPLKRCARRHNGSLHSEDAVSPCEVSQVFIASPDMTA